MTQLVLARARLRGDVPAVAFAALLVPADVDGQVGASHRLLWSVVCRSQCGPAAGFSLAADACWPVSHARPAHAGRYARTVRTGSQAVRARAGARRPARLQPASQRNRVTPDRTWAARRAPRRGDERVAHYLEKRGQRHDTKRRRPPLTATGWAGKVRRTGSHFVATSWWTATTGSRCRVEWRGGGVRGA